MWANLRRITFTAFLILALASVALWVRSYWRCDVVRFHVGGHAVELASYRGGARLWVAGAAVAPDPTKVISWAFIHHKDMGYMGTRGGATTFPAAVAPPTMSEAQEEARRQQFLWQLAVAGQRAALERWGFALRRGGTIEVSFSPGWRMDQRWNIAWAGAGRAFTSAEAPLWALAALTGGWPLAAGVRWSLHRLRLRRRRELGLCLVCGYDLRATPQRCPECGTVPVPSPGTPGEG